MAKQVAKSPMSQTKDDLNPAEGGEKPSHRFPDWLLFLVSTLAIFFSPFGIFGAIVVGDFAIMQNFLFSEALEAILFIVGVIPFVTLLSRGKYALAGLLVIFAIIDIGLLFWVFISILP